MFNTKFVIGSIVFIIVFFGLVVVAPAESTGTYSEAFVAAEEIVSESVVTDATIEVVDLPVFVEEKPVEIVVAPPVYNPPPVVKTEPNYDPGDGSRWDQLAQCETGGNWAANTGNGFGGGLQFMHQSSYSTWLSFGGGEFARNPWDATREQQIIVAERVLASSGWNAWPGCSRKFGWL